MSKNDGGTAFPSDLPFQHLGRDKQTSVISPGMSLRDYFAAEAVQGFMRLSYSSGGGWMLYTKDTERAAKCAYQIADALLAERAK